MFDSQRVSISLHDFTAGIDGYRWLQDQEAQFLDLANFLTLCESGFFMWDTRVSLGAPRTLTVKGALSKSSSLLSTLFECLGFRVLSGKALNCFHRAIPNRSWIWVFSHRNILLMLSVPP